MFKTDSHERYTKNLLGKKIRRIYIKCKGSCGTLGVNELGRKGREREKKEINKKIS